MIAWIQARAAAIIATLLFAAPLLAFLLALAIELRYFSPSRQLPAHWSRGSSCPPPNHRLSSASQLNQRPAHRGARI
ncbi:MAG TPA: hypothetical protein VG816_05865 [Solirubrobacterales bacterium]|nr:hypothetical protein [Solirubrobacterales bacterium]